MVSDSLQLKSDPGIEPKSPALQAHFSDFNYRVRIPKKTMSLNRKNHITTSGMKAILGMELWEKILRESYKIFNTC